MSLEKALVALGFQEAEATLVAFIFEHGKCTAEDIILGTKLSRGTVYKAIKSLSYKNYISKTDSKPVAYVLTPRVSNDIKNQLEIFYKQVSAKLKPLKVVETDVLLKTITTIFEKNGYAIRDPPKRAEEKSALLPRVRGLSLLDKIAEGEYTFGISILDKRKKLEYPKEAIGLFLRTDFYRTSKVFNCVAIFVFIHTDRKDYQSLYRNLAQGVGSVRFRRPFESAENYGVENKEILCFKTDENLPEKITTALQEIHQRRIIVSNMARSLKDRINQIQELVFICQEHARKIDNILLEKEPFQSQLVSRAFDEVGDPIRRIKNRETRNIGIFRRKFSEDEVRINQYLDAIERRIFLPELSSLERDMAELEGLQEKFKPIEYELNDLYSTLFSYGVNIMRSAKIKTKAAINPFVFTEPYEKNGFFVNEKSLEMATNQLSEAISEGLPSFFQIITGEAGIGKTHAARYIYAPLIERQKIKSLYLDCPVNYDLISGIFQELTQESLFPEHLVGTIRELRKNVPSTTRELLRVIDEITILLKNQGYKGVLLILDELENAIPYVFFEKDSLRFPPPLALRQLHEIISQNVTENLGYLICCRRKIYPILKEALKVKNLDEFTHEPEKLEPVHYKDLIQHRYQMWSIKQGPAFETEVLEDLVKITQGNTRDVIKYCRELFKYAMKNNLQFIDRSILKKIGSIPLFRY